MTLIVHGHGAKAREAGLGGNPTLVKGMWDTLNAVFEEQKRNPLVQSSETAKQKPTGRYGLDPTTGRIDVGFMLPVPKGVVPLMRAKKRCRGQSGITHPMYGAFQVLAHQHPASVRNQDLFGGVDFRNLEPSGASDNPIEPKKAVLYDAHKHVVLNGPGAKRSFVSKVTDLRKLPEWAAERVKDQHNKHGASLDSSQQMSSLHMIRVEVTITLHQFNQAGITLANVIDLGRRVAFDALAAVDVRFLQKHELLASQAQLLALVARLRYNPMQDHRYKKQVAAGSSRSGPCDLKYIKAAALVQHHCTGLRYFPGISLPTNGLSKQRDIARHHLLTRVKEMVNQHGILKLFAWLRHYCKVVKGSDRRLNYGPDGTVKYGRDKNCTDGKPTNETQEMCPQQVVQEIAKNLKAQDGGADKLQNFVGSLLDLYFKNGKTQSVGRDTKTGTGGGLCIKLLRNHPTNVPSAKNSKAFPSRESAAKWVAHTFQTEFMYYVKLHAPSVNHVVNVWALEKKTPGERYKACFEAAQAVTQDELETKRRSQLKILERVLARLHRALKILRERECVAINEHVMDEFLRSASNIYDGSCQRIVARVMELPSGHPDSSFEPNDHPQHPLKAVTEEYKKLDLRHNGRHYGLSSIVGLGNQQRNTALDTLQRVFEQEKTRIQEIRVEKEATLAAKLHTESFEMVYDMFIGDKKRHRAMMKSAVLISESQNKGNKRYYARLNGHLRVGAGNATQFAESKSGLWKLIWKKYREQWGLYVRCDYEKMDVKYLGNFEDYFLTKGKYWERLADAGSPRPSFDEASLSEVSSDTDTESGSGPEPVQGKVGTDSGSTLEPNQGNGRSDGFDADNYGSGNDDLDGIDPSDSDHAGGYDSDVLTESHGAGGSSSLVCLRVSRGALWLCKQRPAGSWEPHLKELFCLDKASTKCKLEVSVIGTTVGGTQLLIGSKKGQVWLMNLWSDASPSLLVERPGHDVQALAGEGVTLDRNGGILAVVGWTDGLVEVIADASDLHSGAVLTLAKSEGTLSTLSVASGVVVAASKEAETVRMWGDVRSQMPPTTCQCAYAAALSPDGRQVVTVDVRSTLTVWNRSQGASPFVASRLLGFAAGSGGLPRSLLFVPGDVPTVVLVYDGLRGASQFEVPQSEQMAVRPSLTPKARSSIHNAAAMKSNPNTPNPTQTRPTQHFSTSAHFGLGCFLLTPTHRCMSRTTTQGSGWNEARPLLAST